MRRDDEKVAGHERASLAVRRVLPRPGIVSVWRWHKGVHVAPALTIGLCRLVRPGGCCHSIVALQGAVLARRRRRVRPARARARRVGAGTHDSDCRRPASFHGTFICRRNGVDLVSDQNLRSADGKIRRSRADPLTF